MVRKVLGRTRYSAFSGRNISYFELPIACGSQRGSLLLPPFLAIAKPVLTRAVFFRWLRQFGGPGLILLGLIDNSAIPLPGSMDVFLAVLCAGQRDWWPYYAAMATAGGVIGGYVTYRLAQREKKDWQNASSRLRWRRSTARSRNGGSWRLRYRP